VWRPSVAQTSTRSAVVGWSTAVMGDASLSGGTRGDACGGSAQQERGRRDPFYERARSVQADALSKAFVLFINV